MKIQLRLVALAVAMSIALPAVAQKAPPRDEFYWLGEMNKATAVINTDEGLLAKDVAPRVAQGVAKVIEDGNQPDAKRPSSVITFEPLMIKAAGPEVTLLHAGRSSQDMHSAYRAAILRDNVLALSEQLAKTRDSLIKLAAKNVDTIVPNYTNGVPAQPNSYAHYLLGHAAAFDRDSERLREAYVRLNRSPMGTTVLNGTSWPLNRERMAEYLGFDALVDNAYDAAQMSPIDAPVEVSAVVTSMALHVGAFIEDMLTQYAQPRPWILLQEGGDFTYVSSAMPQKRNPGILNSTRRNASTVIASAQGVVLRAHNIPPGMSDPKEVKENSAMVVSTIAVLKNFDKILNGLVVNPERALEELNSDWTTSQELADLLMRKYQVPFRVGHHFASEIVSFARAKNIKPLDFPYAEAVRIYAEAGKDYKVGQLPMSEAEFRSTLNPIDVVKQRAIKGGPQPAEVSRMLKEAQERIAKDQVWAKTQRTKIAAASTKLNAEFKKLLPAAK
ncbi:MAG: argininosuccinate lyase [Burkholderiaceae bacterium]